MAFNKKHEFSDEDIALSDMARALAHPARVLILKSLARQESCICGKIAEVMPLAQSTVSQHLKELKEAGLIQGTVDGPRICYCINWDRFRHMAEIFRGLFSDISCCCKENKQE